MVYTFIIHNASSTQGWLYGWLSHLPCNNDKVNALQIVSRLVFIRTGNVYPNDELFE